MLTRVRKKSATFSFFSFAIKISPPQRSHAHQVIRRRARREHPSDPSSPAVPHFAQQRDALDPAENFLDPLALPLTHHERTRGARVDVTRAPGMRTPMRRHGEFFRSLVSMAVPSV
jgi:hypothetical protein